MCIHGLLGANSETSGVGRSNMRPMFNQGLRATSTMQVSSSPIQRDSRAWQFQVWASSGIAVFLCATGLAWLPGERLELAFMFMGYVFCLSAAFVLAKFVRDSQQARDGAADTPLWRLVVWGGFAVAMGHGQATGVAGAGARTCQPDGAPARRAVPAHRQRRGLAWTAGSSTVSRFQAPASEGADGTVPRVVLACSGKKCF